MQTELELLRPKQIIISTVWLGFGFWLLWQSWNGNVITSVIFSILVACGLISAYKIATDNKIHHRQGFPAWVAFPIDLCLCGVCVLIGGWMSITGGCVLLSALLELKAFGDIRDD